MQWVVLFIKQGHGTTEPQGGYGEEAKELDSLTQCLYKAGGYHECYKP